MLDKEKLKQQLSEEEFHVTQEKGTEIPFENKYWNNSEKGSYGCRVCGQKLFESDNKLDPTNINWGLQGWPAFEKAIPGSINFVEDKSYGLDRTEAVCSQCGAHLGHYFENAEADSDMHFCVNSCSLDFKGENK
jgi:peptide-methionine (R)-S-oxide reductase